MEMSKKIYNLLIENGLDDVNLLEKSHIVDILNKD